MVAFWYSAQYSYMVLELASWEKASTISSLMSFSIGLALSRTESGLHRIIPEHIMACTHVSEATSAYYQQKYFTTMAQCLQIIFVRRPLVSGGEGPE